MLGDAIARASQGRKNNSGMFSRIRSGGQPLTEYKNSFTIHHAYSKTTRQYRLYTEYPTALTVWTGDLWEAQRKNKTLVPSLLFLVFKFQVSQTDVVIYPSRS